LKSVCGLSVNFAPDLALPLVFSLTVEADFRIPDRGNPFNPKKED
jgi:hypothetical protein